MDTVTARLITLGVKRDIAEDRVRTRKLTEEDVEWNLKLGRSPYWKETLDPEAEAKRRAAYSKRAADLAEAQAVLLIP